VEGIVQRAKARQIGTRSVRRAVSRYRGITAQMIKFMETKRYSVVQDHTELPKLTVTEQDLSEDKETGLESIDFYVDSEGTRKFEQFYRERLVHVLSNNTLLVRFSYPYEVDLDRLNDERDFLEWIRQLLGKSWMTNDHLANFMDAVADIKGFNLHGGC
jgi:hypothetical protein